MPALQACCLRRAFVLQVHVAQREELIGDHSSNANQKLLRRSDHNNKRYQNAAACRNHNHTHASPVGSHPEGISPDTPDLPQTTPWSNTLSPCPPKGWGLPRRTTHVLPETVPRAVYHNNDLMHLRPSPINWRSHHATTYQCYRRM